MQQGCNDGSSGGESRGNGFDDGRAAGFAVASIDDVMRIVLFLIGAASDGADDEVEVWQRMRGVFERRPFVVDEVIFAHPEREMILILLNADGACHAVELDVLFEEFEEIFAGNFHIGEAAADEHLDGSGTELDGGHGAVGGDISAPDDGDTARGLELLRVVEIIHIRGAQFLPGNLERRAVWLSGGDDYCIEIVGECARIIDFGIEVKRDAVGNVNVFPVFFDDIVGEAFVWDHIERAADFFARFEDFDAEAGADKS